MTMASLFTRLVRFEDASLQTYFGELPADHPPLSTLVGLGVKIYGGNGPLSENFELTSITKTIAKVLSPLENLPLFYGVGLNYRAHAEEANFPIPPYPVIFIKPAGAQAGPFEDIPINTEAQWLDYEGELCVVMRKDCKNLSTSENPLDYVLGYCAGNDVSSRWWQQPVQSGSQHGYAKSFDKFAPFGPVLCSTTYIQDPTELTLITRVNGEERQRSKVNDLIFDIGTIIRHLSRGMTLKRGSVIMTGTPSGVGAVMKPPKWLKDGDVVEVEIDKIGVIRNKMVFER